MVGLNQAVDRIFRYGADFLTQVSINGMYGFVLYDNVSDTYIGARDPIGIIPLYIGYGKDGSVWFTSEMKALQEHCDQNFKFSRTYKMSSFTLRDRESCRLTV